MAKNGQKMAKNGQKWAKMIKNDQKCPKMAKNIVKWPNLAIIGHFSAPDQKWPKNSSTIAKNNQE